MDYTLKSHSRMANLSWHIKRLLTTLSGLILEGLFIFIGFVIYSQTFIFYPFIGYPFLIIFIILASFVAVWLQLAVLRTFKKDNENIFTSWLFALKKFAIVWVEMVLTFFLGILILFLLGFLGFIFNFIPFLNIIFNGVVIIAALLFIIYLLMAITFIPVMVADENLSFTSVFKTIFKTVFKKFPLLFLRLILSNYLILIPVFGFIYLLANSIIITNAGTLLFMNATTIGFDITKISYLYGYQLTGIIGGASIGLLFMYVIVINFSLSMEYLVWKSIMSHSE